jgi:uncharacterized repeat protein (TIGR01451 family)
MIRFSKLAAAVAVLPVFAVTASAYAAGTGQIEQGDIYRVKDVTTNSAFADTITAACNDTVQFRVRIHNTGPNALTNVKVAATLNGASSTSHGSQVSLSADNNLDNEVVTASAGVNTSNNTTASFVSGSTQLLNNSGSVLKNLPDGILSGGLNIGSVGPLTTDTEVVQFQAKLTCETPPQVSFACTELDVTNIDRTHFDFTAKGSVQNATITGYTFTTKNANGNVIDTFNNTTSSTTSGVYHFNQETGTYTVSVQLNTDHGNNSNDNCVKQITVAAIPTTPTMPPTTTLPNTGAGDVLGIFSGVSAFGAAGHYVTRRFRR